MIDPLNETFNTEHFKNLINSDKSPDYVDVEEISAEEVDDSNQKFLKEHTFTGLPYAAAESFKALQEKVRKEDEESKKIIEVVSNLFKSLNEKYGLDVTIDLNSFANSLSSIASPTNMRAMELYISEAYARTRVILYQQYLTACIQLSARIFDPAYLLSDSLTFDDKLTTLERLFGLINQVEDVYEKVKISDADMKLQKLAETKKGATDILNDQNVYDFLQALSKAVKDGAQYEN